jgi:predicted nucleotidyltransferase
MRLSDPQHQTIRAAVLSRDPRARLILFGSRTDDRARGGDIDVLVISDRISFDDEWKIRRDIFDRIGWQKLDLVVRRPDQLSDALARHALSEGVAL